MTSPYRGERHCHPQTPGPRREDCPDTPPVAGSPSRVLWPSCPHWGPRGHSRWCSGQDVAGPGCLGVTQAPPRPNAGDAAAIEREPQGRYLGWLRGARDVPAEGCVGLSLRAARAPAVRLGCLSQGCRLLWAPLPSLSANAGLSCQSAAWSPACRSTSRGCPATALVNKERSGVWVEGTASGLSVTTELQEPCSVGAPLPPHARTRTRTRRSGTRGLCSTGLPSPPF